MTALRIASTAEVFFSGSVSLLKIYISLITFNLLEHSGWDTSEIGQIQWFGMHWWPWIKGQGIFIWKSINMSRKQFLNTLLFFHNMIQIIVLSGGGSSTLEVSERHHTNSFGGREAGSKLLHVLNIKQERVFYCFVFVLCILRCLNTDVSAALYNYKWLGVCAVHDQ